jgi:hypothetical protein
MLAYVFWHRPAEGVERETYERAGEDFHRSLAHAPPVGFRGSALHRAQAPPWFPGEGAVDGAPVATVYEDWYFVEDFTALGVLNEAAVAHGHRSVHDEVARRYGSGAAGLYVLREGHVHGSPDEAIWIARPLGAHPAELADLLGDGMDTARSSLWRRALVLGPAPEYCLLAPESPAGVATTRLPEGWTATVCAREALWRG